MQAISSCNFYILFAFTIQCSSERSPLSNSNNEIKLMHCTVMRKTPGVLCDGPLLSRASVNLFLVREPPVKPHPTSPDNLHHLPRKESYSGIVGHKIKRNSDNVLYRIKELLNTTQRKVEGHWLILERY